MYIYSFYKSLAEMYAVGTGKKAIPYLNDTTNNQTYLNGISQVINIYTAHV